MEELILTISDREKDLSEEKQSIGVGVVVKFDDIYAKPTTDDGRNNSLLQLRGSAEVVRIEFPWVIIKLIECEMTLQDGSSRIVRGGEFQVGDGILDREATVIKR